jgi:hypothetical protein
MLYNLSILMISKNNIEFLVDTNDYKFNKSTLNYNK